MHNAADDQARREFWSAEMDAADAFMREVMAYPVVECGEAVVALPAAAAAENLELVFSELAHVNGLPRLYLLRQGLLPGFLGVAREMNERGWIMKVEDAYRTVEMQTGLGRRDVIFKAVLQKVCWECGSGSPPPGLLFRRLGALIATAPKVGTHMSASAIDISVLSRDTGLEIDRGKPYLEMSERTPMHSPFVPERALENRREITELMQRHGFTAYPWEFWHYNAGDAYAELLNHTGRPGRYGSVSVDLNSGQVTPVTEPLKWLNSPAAIKALMGKALLELK